MTKLPTSFKSEQELDSFVTTPSQELIEYMKTLEGDIMVLGAGGKMGPAVSVMAKRATEAAGVSRKIYAVDKFPMEALAKAGIETIECDLLDIDAVRQLPKAKNIVYLVGRKFGSEGNQGLTWAINVIIPSNIGRVFKDCNIVSLSTGCVYPVADINTVGCSEADAPAPVGEYATSCLGRERVFEFYSEINNLNVVNLRLNYSLELRYGVISDIALKVHGGKPVDLTSGYYNGLWQGDTCNCILRSFSFAANPAVPLNITGPETLSVRKTATQLGELMGVEPIFEGEENGKSYLNDATKANAAFGNPSVPVGQVIKWVAQWVGGGGDSWGKPTHFEVQNGKY